MKKLNVVTHNGQFHADDTFATAVLELCGYKLIIKRSRDDKVLAWADVRIDVGGKYSPITGDFDHHQPGGAGQRANGLPYASFGLIWQKYGQQLTGSPKVADLVDKRLVQVIDAEDNGITVSTSATPGVRQYGVAKLIGSFNPTWLEGLDPKEYDKAFFRALIFAKQVLERAIVEAKALANGEDRVKTAIAEAEDSRVIVLDNFYPWRDIIINDAPNALYVVYPVQANDWRVECVRIAPDSFENRRSLPAKWAGKRGPQLASLTNVADATFSHTGRFIAGAKTKAGALALAKLAISEVQEPRL